MTTKVLTGTYPAGYSLAAEFSTLSITASGYVEGAGVEIIGTAGDSYTLTNKGRIIGADTNYYNAVFVYSSGGEITNGSATNTTAKIEGWRGVQLEDSAGGGGEGTVSNFATIIGDVRSGVLIDSYNGGLGGAMVTNGGAHDTTALIQGGSASDGVAIEGLDATVKNFGTITGANGVFFEYGGVITNGSATDTTAAIGQITSVTTYGTAVAGGIFTYYATETTTVTNFGTIGGPDGIYLAGGGVVTNGSATDTGATVIGNTFTLTGGSQVNTAAVYMRAFGKVNNFGTIYGNDTQGVVLTAGGKLTNGSAADTDAFVGGANGVVISGAAGAVNNFGTVDGATQSGVILASGGVLINGSATDKRALIEAPSGYGVVTSYEGTLASAKVTNFGTIEDGVNLGAQGSLMNGSSADKSALIEGAMGVTAGGGVAVTITNYGTVSSTTGVAVSLGFGGDVLVVEAQSAFIGAVLGGGGTLELANGNGKLTGLLSGGEVTVSGSMAPTTFQDFDLVVIGGAATFSTVGAVNLVDGQVVDDEGTLTLGASGKASITNGGLIETTGAGVMTLAGAVDNTGTIAADGGLLTVSKSLSGAGELSIKGGTLDIALATSQNISFNGGAGILELGQSQGYTGTITGFSKSGATSLDLDDISFMSSDEATFLGNKAGGVLTVTDGAHTASINLTGNYSTSTFVAAANGSGVSVTIQPPPTIAGGPTDRFVAAMAGLGGAALTGVHSSEAWSARQPLLATPAR